MIPSNPVALVSLREHSAFSHVLSSAVKVDDGDLCYKENVILWWM